MLGYIERILQKYQYERGIQTEHQPHAFNTPDYVERYSMPSK